MSVCEFSRLFLKKPNFFYHVNYKRLNELPYKSTDSRPNAFVRLKYSFTQFVSRFADLSRVIVNNSIQFCNNNFWSGN